MDSNKQILHIINNEYYQLQDRLMRIGFDSSLILLVINGMKEKALEEVNAILMSDLMQEELKKQEKAETERGE